MTPVSLVDCMRACLPLSAAVLRGSLLLAVCFGMFSSLPEARATLPLLSNHDFSNGLIDWQTTGNVQPSSNFAVLIDSTSGISTLHQSVSLGPELYLLSFDFFNGLSSDASLGTLLDTAFVTLYFGDNPFVSPSDSGSFDEFTGLFDLDANGARNVAAGAVIEPHPTLPGWQRFRIEFPSSRQYVTPFVELVDQNFFDLDSSFALDSVQLAIVPEPTTLLLSLSGALLILFCYGRRGLS